MTMRANATAMGLRNATIRRTSAGRVCASMALRDIAPIATAADIRRRRSAVRSSACRRQLLRCDRAAGRPKNDFQAVFEDLPLRGNRTLPLCQQYGFTVGSIL